MDWQIGTSPVAAIDAFMTETVLSADLDGDGDKDVLTESMGDGNIIWYESLDGQGALRALALIRAAIESAPTGKQVKLEI